MIKQRTAEWINRYGVHVVSYILSVLLALVAILAIAGDPYAAP